MRQTHLPVIYPLLFVTAAHLMLLTVLWTTPRTDLTSPLTPISVAHPITATFLNTTPLQQTDRQATSIKRPPTSRLAQNKIVQSTVRTKQPAASKFAMPGSTPSPTQTSKSSPNNKVAFTSASPKLLHTVHHLDCSIAQPRYPILARRHEEAGTALIRIVVSAYGAIEQATVIQSSGSNRLDYAAREAALASTCHPYQLNGQPLRAAVNLRFKFSLLN